MSIETQKKNKLKILKYIILVLITSIIAFVGSLVGLKIIDDSYTFDFTNNSFSSSYGLSWVQTGYIGAFIGFFATFLFILITLWVIIATFIAFFNIFKSEKRTIFWKIFGVVFLLTTIALAALVVTFSVLFLIDFVDFMKKIKFNHYWSTQTWFGFDNIMFRNNQYYILLFVFAISWAISAILYNVAFNVLGNFKKEKKSKLQNSPINNEVISEKIETASEVNQEQTNQEQVNNLKEEVSNEEIKNETNEQVNQPSVEPKVEKVEEDDWLMNMYKESGSPAPENVQSSPISSAPKDENDPYSLFD